MDNSEIAFVDIFREGIYENLSSLADGKLITEDGWTFDIHRIILARDNRYFRALFCSIGKDRTVISIPGIRGEILNQILRYIYTGNIHINNRNICELLLASDYLLVDSLVQRVKKYLEINLSMENCFQIYMTAVEISHEEIATSTYRFIQSNFEKLMYEDPAEFTELPLELLKRILQDNNLCVRGEHVIWHSIVKWVNKDSPNRLSDVRSLLQCLKLGQVDEELAKDILSNDIVTKSPFYKELKSFDLHRDSSNELDVLCRYLTENELYPPVDLDGNRYPKYLNIITRYHIHNLNDGIQLYITYDENVDIWRKLGESEFCPTFITVVGHSVYMFDAFDNKVTFDLLEKQWGTLRNFRVPRASYCLATLRNNIFVIGGEHLMSGDDVLLVDFYVPEMDAWLEAAPMLPVASYAAVTYQDRIYVVGKRKGEMTFAMMAQVYDVEADEWLEFTPPSIFRVDFAFFEYHSKLYILGGSNGKELCNKVEVFDFATNIWELTTDLPHSYYLPKALVMNDQLIVFDCLLEDPSYLRKSPPILWNEKEETWEPLDESLPLKDLALYLFSTINDKERISMFVRDNRDLGVQFEKSPFN